jgi:molybdopterin synthase sulfur carrier subunit
MEILISLSASLARYADNHKTIKCNLYEGNTLMDMIDALGKKYPDLKRALCPVEGEIEESINIYVNGENVRYLNGLNTLLIQGADVNIIPSAAAG